MASWCCILWLVFILHLWWLFYMDFVTQRQRVHKLPINFPFIYLPFSFKTVINQDSIGKDKKFCFPLPDQAALVGRALSCLLWCGKGSQGTLGLMSRMAEGTKEQENYVNSSSHTRCVISDCNSPHPFCIRFQSVILLFLLTVPAFPRGNHPHEKAIEIMQNSKCFLFSDLLCFWGWLVASSPSRKPV